MITFAKSFKASDGRLFGTVQEAQSYELELVVKKEGDDGRVQSVSSAMENFPKYFAEKIMENRELILDILTTTNASKPKARAINGGTKKRKRNSVPGVTVVECDPINVVEEGPDLSIKPPVYEKTSHVV